MNEWSTWQKFPDPMQKGILHAPFGPGVYELRDSRTKEMIIRGKGKNCAFRMSSLLPRPLGQGTRKNSKKKEFVKNNLSIMEYRVFACSSDSEAIQLERKLNAEQPCLFPT